MTIDIASLQPWIGRQETADDAIAAFPASALAATLDRDDRYDAGSALPPVWHWIYFHELHKTSELADNGHGKLGGFMPPMPLPRRMWAGGRFTFGPPLRVGQAARRVSTVAGLTAKARRERRARIPGAAPRVQRSRRHGGCRGAGHRLPGGAASGRDAAGAAAGDRQGGMAARDRRPAKRSSSAIPRSSSTPTASTTTSRTASRKAIPG